MQPRSLYCSWRECLLGSFAKVVLYQLFQSLDGLGFVLTVGPDSNLCALVDAQRQDLENALGINLVAFLANRDAGLEPFSGFDKVCGWSGVQTHLVVNDECDFLHRL
jgi:hypothetical protein